MKSINCMLGTPFNEAHKVEQDIYDFVRTHKEPAAYQTPVNGYYVETRGWEYSMAIAFTNPQPGQKILDVGGSNSILSWYLACKGVHVVGADFLPMHEERGLINKKYFGIDNIEFFTGNARDVKGEFDFIYNICVFEHVMQQFREKTKGRYGNNFWGNNYEPTPEEWEAERSLLRHHADCLKPGGILVISYDALWHAGKKTNGRASALRSVEDVENRIVKESGLELFGGSINGDPHPDGKHCIGIVFLKKPI
jgi:SAM-dependent methyltransferase